ncbi:L-rhamnose isomerase [Paenibacillus sp. 1-18]|uniref:L-rhamnose isomerase n=1 Tax=Paenibacillus sp. 1-18 TaxID=1333846 RepID=UPI0004712DE6
MNEAIEASYNEAKKLYARHDIQVDDVLRKLSDIKISLHCWQGDDVQGFLFKDKQLSGGIAVTGSSIDEAFGLIETIEKAAQIYMLIAHHDIQQRITDQELADLAKAFNVTPKKGILNV